MLRRSRSTQVALGKLLSFLETHEIPLLKDIPAVRTKADFAKRRAFTKKLHKGLVEASSDFALYMDSSMTKSFNSYMNSVARKHGLSGTDKKLLRDLNFNRKTDKFLGKTISDRVTDAYNRRAGALLDEYKDLSKTVKSKRFLKVQLEERIYGKSKSLRSDLARITVSERARAERDFQKDVTRIKGFNAVKWILSTLPKRKRDICDKYNESVIYGEPGVYPLRKAPPYPHPFCGCTWKPYNLYPGIYSPEEGEEVLDHIKGNRLSRISSDLVKSYAMDYRRFTLRKPESFAKAEEAFRRKMDFSSTKAYDGLDTSFMKKFKKGRRLAVEEIMSISDIVPDKALLDFAERFGAENTFSLMKSNLDLKGSKLSLIKIKKMVTEKARGAQELFKEKSSVLAKYRHILVDPKITTGQRSYYKVAYNTELRLLRETYGEMTAYVDTLEKYISAFDKKAKDLILSFETKVKARAYMKKMGVKDSAWKMGATPEGQLVRITDRKENIKLLDFQKSKNASIKKLDDIKTARGESAFVSDVFDYRGYKAYPDQIAGAKFIEESKKAIINFGVGRGKTDTAIIAGERLANAGKVKKILYVTKKDLSGQVQEDIMKARSKSSTNLAHMSKKKRLEYYENVKKGEGSRWTVISHSQLERDASFLKRFDMVIVDEFHELAISGRMAPTKLGKSLLKLNPEYKVMMSGTVIDKTASELYFAAKWLRPKEFSSMKRFTLKMKSVLQGSETFNLNTTKRMKDLLGDSIISARTDIFMPIPSKHPIEKAYKDKLFELLRTKKSIPGAVDRIVEVEKALLKAEGQIKVMLQETLLEEKKGLVLLRKEAVILEKKVGKLEKVYAKIPIKVKKASLIEEEMIGIPLSKEQDKKIEALLQRDIKKGLTSTKKKEIFNIINDEDLAKNGKVKALTGLLDEEVAKGSKSIVFTQDDTLAKDMKKYYQKKYGEDAVVSMDRGSIKNMGGKDEIRRAFQTDPKVKILLLPEHATTGVNLNSADNMIDYVASSSARVRTQRTGRGFRGFRNTDIKQIRMYADSPLEESLRSSAIATQSKIDRMFDIDLINESDQLKMFRKMSGTGTIDKLSARKLRTPGLLGMGEVSPEKVGFIADKLVRRGQFSENIDWDSFPVKNIPDKKNVKKLKLFMEKGEDKMRSDFEEVWGKFDIDKIDDKRIVEHYKHYQH